MNKEVLATVCAEVEAVFVKHGGLSASDLDAVFGRLRRKADGHKPEDRPKAGVVWQIPDLIKTNLEYALEHYDWTGYAPVAMSNGKLIESIVALDDNGNPPVGYTWLPGQRVLLKQDAQAATNAAR